MTNCLRSVYTYCTSTDLSPNIKLKNTCIQRDLNSGNSCVLLHSSEVGGLQVPRVHARTAHVLSACKNTDRFPMHNNKNISCKTKKLLKSQLDMVRFLFLPNDGKNNKDTD